MISIIGALMAEPKMWAKCCLSTRWTTIPFISFLTTISQSILYVTSDDKNLVVAFDAIEQVKIPKKKSFNKYLVNCDIIEALKDPDYFIKLIEICEKNRNEEIERIEKGIPEEVPEEKKKTEWELLMESSDKEYLRKTILPLLYPVFDE